MTTRCQCCEKLFLSDLVALAQKEFTANEFPQNSFYQHHSSFDALEQAANDGCNFCQLVLECFKGTPSRESTGDLLWPKEWLRGDCDVSESMYAEAKDLDESSIKIAINSTHVYATVDLDAVEAFDALLVRVGPNECQLDPFDDDSPILCLTLSTPRGTSLPLCRGKPPMTN